MPGIGIIKSFLEQATAESSKSTVMKPLNWLIVILISGTITAFYFNLPKGISYTSSILTGLTIVVYLIVYFYCLFTDKDALRSEKFIVQKLAIEKGFVGDSSMGKIEIDSISANKRLESKNTIVNEKD